MQFNEPASIKPVRHVIVGTAGHIDHGKSTLVRALTGIDPDRLAEEKRRGITIDIGFAHLGLEEFQVAFIDVPGHERFIKNMLAGIGGVRVVLLVVAADESVMPQTVEHFQICRLLGIRRGLIAVTKSDLADPEMLELVHEDIRELVRGSFLEPAPVVEVDSLSGRGLDRLRQQLLEQLRQESGDPALDRRTFRLPIDRVFSVRGFGTVVTGTVVAGTLKVDSPVEIQPGSRTAKVRGIEILGAPVKTAPAGRRTALNLSGVDRADLVRGMVVTEPGSARPTAIMDVRLHHLDTAPAPLRHRAPVRFHHGTSELVGRIYLLEGDQLPPGSSALCRVRLQEGTVAFPGDRFILRRYSPPTTVGGGIVLDNQPGRVRRRDLPRLLPALGNLASALENGSDAERVLVRYLVQREGIRGLGLDALVARTGLRRDVIAALCAETPELEQLPQPPLVVWAAELAEREAIALKLLEEFHDSRPLAPGMSREELKRRLLPESADALFPVLLEHLQQAGRIEVQGSFVKLTGRQPGLSGEQQQTRRTILEWFDAHPFEEASPEKLAGSLGLPPAAVRELFFFLLQSGELVRISEDLVLPGSRLDAIRRELKQRFAERPFTVPDFKDLFGISRKFAIPLLEYLDRTRFTRRTGDLRVLV